LFASPTGYFPSASAAIVATDSVGLVRKALIFATGLPCIIGHYETLPNSPGGHLLLSFSCKSFYPALQGSPVPAANLTKAVL